MMLLLFSHSHQRMLGCHTRVNDVSNHFFLRRNIIKFRKSRTMCSSAVVRIELGSDAKVSSAKKSQRRNSDLRKKEKNRAKFCGRPKKYKNSLRMLVLDDSQSSISLPLRCKRYTFTAALEKFIQIQFQLFVFVALITLGLRLDAVWYG